MMRTQQHYKPSHFIYQKCLLHLICFAWFLQYIFTLLRPTLKPIIFYTFILNGIYLCILVYVKLLFRQNKNGINIFLVLFSWREKKNKITSTITLNDEDIICSHTALLGNSDENYIFLPSQAIITITENGKKNRH